MGTLSVSSGPDPGLQSWQMPLRNYASLAVVVLISLSLIGGTLGIVYLFYNKMFCFDEGSSQTAAVELTPQRGV